VGALYLSAGWITFAHELVLFILKRTTFELLALIDFSEIGWLGPLGQQMCFLNCCLFSSRKIINTPQLYDRDPLAQG
jgi:hypothetical protein